MIDLTPLDVRKKKGDFRRVLRGYDPGEVDTFLDLVEARLKTLVMDNLSLTEKVQRLTSQLEALEGREKAVQDALVTAQKLREDVQTQSRRDADSLKEQAIREADSVREGARREVSLLRKELLGEVEARVLEAEGLIRERKRALEELERSRRKFLKGFRSLLERELDAVEVEESRRPLEDTPLELELRGWTRARFAEVEDEPREEPRMETREEPREEPEDASGEGTASWLEASPPPGLEAPPPPGYEPIIDLDQAEDLEEEGGGDEWIVHPGDEPPQGEFSDIVPVGDFELPPGGEMPTGLRFGEEEVGDGAVDRDWEAEVEALDAELEVADSEPGPSDEPGRAGGEEDGIAPEADGTPRGAGTAHGDGPSDPRGVDASFGSTVDEILGGRSGRREEPPSEPLWLSSLLEQEEAAGRSPEEKRGSGAADPTAEAAEGGAGADEPREGSDGRDDEEESRAD